MEASLLSSLCGCVWLRVAACGCVWLCDSGCVCGCVCVWLCVTVCVAVFVRCFSAEATAFVRLRGLLAPTATASTLEVSTHTVGVAAENTCVVEGITGVLKVLKKSRVPKLRDLLTTCQCVTVHTHDDRCGPEVCMAASRCVPGWTPEVRACLL